MAGAGGLEWSRLCLHLRAAHTTGGDGPGGDGPGEGELLSWSRALFAAAVRDGWAVDGADGFVYTTDWDGLPVMRNRLHWVHAEAIAAAAALWRATGEAGYAQWHGLWWAYARQHLIDARGGSWHHELDPAGRPATGTWAGKPDAYHAVQAALLPLLPLHPGIALGARRLPFTRGD